MTKTCYFICDKFLGDQLVSHTRQMDLVRIQDQAKFENASLRTKHFRIHVHCTQSQRIRMALKIPLVSVLLLITLGAIRIGSSAEGI